MARLSKQDQRLTVLTFRYSVCEDDTKSRLVGGVVMDEWKKYSQETKDKLRQMINEKLDGLDTLGGSQLNDDFWFGLKYFMDMDGRKE